MSADTGKHIAVKLCPHRYVSDISKHELFSLLIRRLIIEKKGTDQAVYPLHRYYVSYMMSKQNGCPSGSSMTAPSPASAY